LFDTDADPFFFLSFLREYVETAVRHVMMRQGILGVKVAIMLPHDPKGIIGPKSLLSDVITILEPKGEDHRGY
jgi:small subunit ribosomal protein S3e